MRSIGKKKGGKKEKTAGRSSKGSTDGSESAKKVLLESPPPESGDHQELTDEERKAIQAKLQNLQSQWIEEIRLGKETGESFDMSTLGTPTKKGAAVERIPLDDEDDLSTRTPKKNTTGSRSGAAVLKNRPIKRPSRDLTNDTDNMIEPGQGLNEELFSAIKEEIRLGIKLEFEKLSRSLEERLDGRLRELEKEILQEIRSPEMLSDDNDPWQNMARERPRPRRRFR